MPEPPNNSSTEEATGEQAPPLSLNRLTEAFAEMFRAPESAAVDGNSGDSEPAAEAPPRDPCEIGPQSIIEAVLFIGSSDNQARSAEQLASAMRGVTLEETIEAVQQLNAAYERDAAPYRIVEEEGGFRLQLEPDLARLRDKFQGRVKQSQLSPAALEVLSLVAYQQPITAARIDRQRGVSSGSLLASLVNRGLVRIDRSGSDPSTADAETQREAKKRQAAAYRTTERFLRLFGLGAIDQLPRVAELD